MKFTFLLVAFLLSTVSFAQVCTFQGHFKKEVITLAIVNSGGQIYLRQTSNVRKYIVSSEVRESNDTRSFHSYAGALSAPPFWPGTLFRLSVSKENPERSVYEVIGTYRTVPFLANCQP